jgi:hypothetical protein
MQNLSPEFLLHLQKQWENSVMMLASTQETFSRSIPSCIKQRHMMYREYKEINYQNNPLVRTWGRTTIYEEFCLKLFSNDLHA